MWAWFWVLWGGGVAHGLKVLSSYRNSGSGGDSTLLELSFDQSDVPSQQAEGVLHFQVEGAAIGAGLRGLLHGTLAVSPPSTVVERNLLGYVPESLYTQTFSVCDKLQNEAQVAGATEREAVFADYSLKARTTQRAAEARRRLQQAPGRADVSRCEAYGPDALACEKLDASSPGRYVCFQYLSQQAALFSFCIDSRQCLGGASDALCLQEIAYCQANSLLPMYGGSVKCEPACTVGEYCSAVSRDGQETGECREIAATLGAPQVGDPPGSGNCFNEVVTKALTQQMHEKFTRAFPAAYKGLTDLQAELDKTAEVYDSALTGLRDAGNQQEETLKQLLLNMHTLNAQRATITNLTDVGFKQLEAAMQRFKDHEASLVDEFNKNTEDAYQLLQASEEGMLAQDKAMQALFRAVLAQGNLQSTLMGEFTVDLAALLDMARTTLAEVRELQTAERPRRALSSLLFAYADQARERYGATLLAEGGVPPLGYARVSDPAAPYWFRFTALLQFEQSAMPQLSSSKNFSEWALQDPEIREEYELYQPNSSDLNPAWLAGDEPLTVEQYWSLPGPEPTSTALNQGKFTRYAYELNRMVGGGTNTWDKMRWLLLHTVRFYCDPQFLLEQGDNWFTFRDIMLLLGPPGCVPPELGTGAARPANSCNCWARVSRRRCLRGPTAPRPWTPSTSAPAAFWAEFEDGTCGGVVLGKDVGASFYGGWFPRSAPESVLTSDTELAVLLHTWCNVAMAGAAVPGSRLYVNHNLLELALQLRPGATPRAGPWQAFPQPSAEAFRYCSTHWADIEPQSSLLRNRSGVAGAAALPFLFFYSAQLATRFLRQRELTQVLIDVAGDLPDDVELGRRPFFLPSPVQLRAPQLPPALGDPAWTVPPDVSNCDTLTAAFSTPELLPLWHLRHVETTQRYVLTLRNLDTGLDFTQELVVPRAHQLPAESVLVLGYLSCLHHWCGVVNEYSFVYDVLPEEVSGHPHAGLRFTDYVMFFPEDGAGAFEQNRHLLFPLDCHAPLAGQCDAADTVPECEPHRLDQRARVPGESQASFWKRQHLQARLDPRRQGRSPVDSRKRLRNGTPWQQRRCEERGPEGPLCELLRTHWWPNPDFRAGETLDSADCAAGRLALRPQNWSSRVLFDVPGSSFARRDSVASWCPVDGSALVAPRSGYAGDAGLRLRFRQAADAGGGAPRPLRLEVFGPAGVVAQTDAPYPSEPGLYWLDLPGTDSPPERAAALANGTSGLSVRFSVGRTGPPDYECFVLSLDEGAAAGRVSFFSADTGGGAGDLAPTVIEHMWLDMQRGASTTATAASLATAQLAAATGKMLGRVAGAAGDPAALASIFNSWENDLAVLRALLLASFAQNADYLRESAASFAALSTQLAETINRTNSVLAQFDQQYAAVEDQLAQLNASLNQSAVEQLEARWRRWSDDVHALGRSLGNAGLFQQVVTGYVKSTVSSPWVVRQPVEVPAVRVPAQRRRRWEGLVGGFTDPLRNGGRAFGRDAANFFRKVGKWAEKAADCAGDIFTKLNFNCLAPHAPLCEIDKPPVWGLFCYSPDHGTFYGCRRGDKRNGKRRYYRTDGSLDVPVVCDARRAAWTGRYLLRWLIVTTIVVGSVMAIAALAYGVAKLVLFCLNLQNQVSIRKGFVREARLNSQKTGLLDEDREGSGSESDSEGGAGENKKTKRKYKAKRKPPAARKGRKKNTLSKVIKKVGRTVAKLGKHR